MKYRVVWRKRVVDQLHTAAFLAIEKGGSEKPIEEAVATINQHLTTDPNEQGESRGVNERVLIVTPLTIWFEVFEQTSVVIVYDAILYPRRRY